MSRPYDILLVEDSRTQALNLSHALERQGWKVDWAPTVEAAMERLNQTSPDLIVLDYYLPGISGDELCRRIRMNIRTRSIPILMLTMDETHEAELRGLESGADDFVPKSIDAEVLLARIRMLLGKSATQLSIPGLVDQRFRRARLLTIDDSSTYQQYLAAELEQEGYLIEKAMSGSEGLEKILKEPFDCVLVDLVMPEVDGIEVCRQVSRLRSTTDNSVALLILTGQESKDDLTRALEAGADDFVGKSSDMAVLKGRIRALLRRKFCEEDNRRVAEELKSKEVELVRARAEREVAESRAALNEQLERRVEERTAELAEVNRNLAQQTQENEMFVYSVSHDLRSPLVNLQGFAKELALVCQELHGVVADDAIPAAMRQRGMQLIDGDMGEAIRFIQSAVLRLSKIIDALLRLSRAGRVEYQWRPIELQPIVRGIVDSLANTTAEHNATVLVYDLPMVWGDPTAVEQIFANLLGNSLNYLDDSREGRIEIGALPESEPNLVTVFVRDNGLGIPAAFKGKVFQAFQRVHPTVAKGEGVGLTLVHRIVERHHGKIWFESAEGEGTTFFVTLPVSRPSDSVADALECNGPQHLEAAGRANGVRRVASCVGVR